MSISHAFSAAFCIWGESECPIGSPNTPNLIEGVTPRVAFFQILRSACVWISFTSLSATFARHNDNARSESNPFRFYTRCRCRGCEIGKACGDSYPLPARAKWLSPHRPRQSDLPELRHRT